MRLVWALAIGIGMMGCNESATEPGEAGRVDTVYVKDTVMVGIGEKAADCMVLEKFTREGLSLAVPKKTVYPLDAQGKCPIPDPTGGSTTTCEKTVFEETKIPKSYWLSFKGDKGGVSLVGVTESEYSAAREFTSYEKCPG